MSPHPADAYLVLRGPRAATRTNRPLPLRIDSVYLLDRHALLADLNARGVRVGIATSVRKEHWERGRIYPRSDVSPLQLADDQIELLRLFAWSPRAEAQLVYADVSVVGVDGAPAGWVAAELVECELASVRVFPDLHSLLQAYPIAAVVAVDIPIGPERRRRA